MKHSLVLGFVFATFAGPGSAKIIPLDCKDYILLTETAVQQRDSKISREESLSYLGGDEFMSNRDKKIVRQMIVRVFQKANEGLAYHINQTKKECATKLTAPR